MTEDTLTLQSAPRLARQGAAASIAWARLDALLMLVCFVAVFLMMWPTVALEVDPHHDGLILKSARDVAFGSIPFRDSFTQYGLLLSLLHGATLKIVGMSLKVLRIETVLFYAATGSLLFLLWSQFIGRKLAVFSVLIWIALGPFYMFALLPWSSATALVFQVATIALACRYWKHRSISMLIGAATMAAVVFWIRMPVGVLLLAALGFIIVASATVQSYLFKRRFWAEVGALVLGAMAVSIPCIGYLAVFGALRDWFFQTFLLAFVFAKTIPVAWNGDESQIHALLLSLFPLHLNVIWVLFPLASVQAFLHVIWRFYRSPDSRADPQKWAIFTLATVCIASWPQYFPVSEERHVFWASTPMVGLFVFVVMQALSHYPWQITRRMPQRFETWRAGVSERLSRPLHRQVALLRVAALADRIPFRLPRRNAVLPVMLVVGVCAAPPILQRWDALMIRRSEFNTLIERPQILRGLYTTPTGRAVLVAMDDDIVRLQNEFPGRPVITTGYDPLPLTFGSYTPNWHPLFVYYDIGVAVYPDFPKQLGEFLRKVHPIVVTSGYDLLDSGYRVVGEYANGLTLIAPGQQNVRPLLRPLADDASHVLVHMAVTNRFNLGSPMRITGHRMQATPFNQNGTIEFVVRPNEIEGIGAQLVGNMFGPQPFSGFAVRRAGLNGEYEVTVGVLDEQREKPIFRFKTLPLQCNHVVIRRNGNFWDVWVNGTRSGQTTMLGLDTASPNQLIVNNGMSRLEYHVGLVDEIRILDRTMSMEEIADAADYSLGLCKRSARN